MGLFDAFRKGSFVLIETADFSKENAQGPMVARVEGGAGLIRKDGTVDMQNLMGILESVRFCLPTLIAQPDFLVWCGEPGKKAGEPIARFYDLLRIKGLPVKIDGKVQFGFDHVDLRKMPNGASGVTFDPKLIETTRKINYAWKK